MITCIDCGTEVKRKTNAHKRCPECAAVALRSYQKKYRADNRERRAGINAIYRAENHELIREKQAKYRAENRASLREKDADYRTRNRELHQERSERFYYENRELVRESRTRYNAENPSVEIRGRERRRIRDAAIDASRSGAPWSDSEDAVLMSWTEGDRELGAVLGRTRKSVGERRRLLRKRAAEQEVYP